MGDTMPLTLPSHLTAQLRAGKVVLVLGAGASSTSLNRNRQPIIGSSELVNLLASQCGFTYSDEPLTEVFEAAQTILGEHDLKDLLTSHFSNCRPSDDLISIFRYTWRRIYTFNIDDAMHFAPRNKRIQELQFINAMREKRKDWDGFDKCQVIHLHGLASEYDSGIIFSETQYATATISHGPWYEKLGEDFSNYTLLFLGTKLNEPLFLYHANRFLDRYSQAGRSYLLSPTQPTAIRLQALSNKNIEHLQGSLSDLATTLSELYPDGLSPSEITDGGMNAPAYSLTPRDIEALRSIYPIARSRLTSSPQYSEQNQRHIGKLFYEGYGPTWATILNDVHVTLNQYNTLSAKIMELLDGDARVICITGEAGSGKSTLTYAVALEAAESSKVSVYEYRDDSTSIKAVFAALKKYNDGLGHSKVLVFIDNLHLYYDELGEVLSDNKYNFITLLTSCRKSDWNSRIAAHLPGDTVLLNLNRFSERDIPFVIEKVSQYMASPKFTRLSYEDKTQRFRWSKRQLLIALKEATESQKFEDIIMDELTNVRDQESKFILGVIAWSTVARAGIQDSMLAGIYGMVRRGTSYSTALANLEGIVDKSRRGRYVARHQVYAEEIIKGFIHSDLMYEVIDYIFAYFSQFEMPVIRQVNKSDGQLFKYSVSNSNLYNFFKGRNRREEGVKLYRNYLVEFQLDGHYWLQLGLYQRRLGQQKDALESFQQSIAAYGDNPFAHHAFAHQKLIVASVAESYGRREKVYVDEAVEYLIGRHYAQSAQPNAVEVDEYPIVTLGKYHIDVLMKHGLRNEAVENAKKYFSMAEEMRPNQAGTMVERMKGNLLKFVVGGEWKPLRHRLGELILR